MALAECIIDGVRRQHGEWFPVEAHRWPHLVQIGLVVSHSIQKRNTMRIELSSKPSNDTSSAGSASTPGVADTASLNAR